MNKMNLNKDCGNSESVESIRWEDGRHAERHVKESFDPCTGEGERVVEYYVEEERPKSLQKVVRETIGKRVVKRVVEDVDAEGNVTSRVVEATEPEPSLQVIERQAVAPFVHEEESECYVTREEMVDMFVNAVNKVKNSASSTSVRNQTSVASFVPNMQEQLKSKLLNEEEGSQWGGQVVTVGLLAMITAEAVLLAWVLFFM